ncbi:hemagglutinin repeat-containing protein [Pseudomonas sp. MOB-449]|nr:hemagglutinin repeat-containing protein [Pseudomonas sp. MOB-449]
MDVRSPLNQCIALALAGILFLNPIVVAAAELAVDASSGGNTQLGQAGNGVPVVNIATPSGSGLSHNKFSEYNVGQQGLILNNATGKTQTTQLGGIIVGNPNLQGSAASTILNEVTGGNRSRLAGYTEVAGQSARVIVANPHGITCNGCGFINTPRVTLSTGKPVVDGGQLQRFQVDGGDIALEGSGLNAGNIDRFELITRSARLNAELHAQRLDIITGRNDVQADSLAATPRAEDGSAKPELALDSAALGGMYAGAIRLMGTEAGVGVKLAGNLAASAGDIHIDANGQVTLAQTAAAGDLQVKAQGAELTSKAYVGGSAVLETQGDLAIRQSLAAKDAVRLSSGGQLRNSGIVEAGVNPDSSRNGGGDLQVRARDVRNAGSLVANRSLDIGASQTLDNQGGTLSAQGNTRVSASKLDNRQGRVLAKGDLVLSAGELDNQAGLVNGAGQVHAQMGHLDNRGGKVIGEQHLQLNASASLDNGDGLLGSNGDVRLDAGSLRNRAGEISSGGATRIQAASLDNQGGAVLGDQGLSVTLSGALDNQGGTLGTGRDLELQAASLDNRRGTLVADGGLNARVGGLLDNQDQGGLLAKGPMAIQAGRVDNRTGQVSGLGPVTITANQLDNRAGRLAANGPLVLRTDQLDNGEQGQITSKDRFDHQGRRVDNQGGRITAAGPLSITAEEVQNAQGRIASQGDLSATLGTLAQQGGELVAQGNLHLQARTLDNRQGGLVGSTKALKLEVGDIDNRGGELSSQTDTSLAGQRLDNSGGKLLAGNQLALAVDRVINQAKGLIFGRHAITLDAHSLDNSGGTLASAASLVIALVTKDGALEGELVNRQGLISSEGTLALQASRIDNQGGALSSAGNLHLTTAGQLDNKSGSVVADGALNLASASLDNSKAGVISAKGHARIATGALNNSQGGQLTTVGTLDLAAGQVDNSGSGRIAGGQGLTAKITGLDQHDGGELFSKTDLSLDLQQGLLNNSNGGLINSPGRLLLQNLGRVINRGGEISSQQNFILAARQLDNTGGKLLSNQALALRIAQALDNVKGTVSAKGLDLRAGSLDNREGLLNSRDLFTLAVTGHFDNQRGAVAATGTLDLTASTLDNRVGEIAGKADVRANVGTLDQRGGLLIAQGALNLKSQHLDNSADGLVGATQGLSLAVDEIDNRGGEISSQEAVQIFGRQFDNSDEGRLLAGTRLGLTIERLVNRAKGLISGKTGVELVGSSLDNTGGRLLSQQAVDISLQGALANGQGLINSEGHLDLNIASLDNTAGSLSSAGAMILTSRGGLNNRRGQLVTDSTLSLASDSLSNLQGVLSAKGKTQLTTGRLDNSLGQLTSAETLDLTTSELINHGGRIGSNQALSVTASGLAQQGGQLFSNAGLSLDLQGGDLDNRQGLINAPGQLLLKNLGSIHNQGGEISSQQAFTLAARSLDNASGKLLGAQALTLRIDQALANLKGLIAAACLDVAAASLANAGGTLTSRSTTHVDIAGALANDQQGLINAAQQLTLKAGSLDNRGGSLLAGSALDLRAQSVDNRDNGLINSQGGLDLQAGTLDSSQGGEVSAKGALSLVLERLIQRQGRLIGAVGLSLDLQGGDLDNQGGLLLAQGPLSLQRLRDLSNQSGEISSGESFVLDLRDLDNSGGKLISSGQLGLSGAQLRNQGGLLSGWQGLTVSGQSLDNRNLGTLSSRSGDLSVNLSGALQNSGDGALVSQGQLDLRAVSLDNSNKGILSSGGDQQLEIATTLNNSAGGQIDSGAKLTLQAAGLNNTIGTLQAQQALELRATDLDNSGGSIAGNGTVTLDLLGALDNANGKLASVGPLVLLRATQVHNQSGQIVSQGLLTLFAGGLDNRNRGTVAANAALLLTATGAVQNDNDGLIFSRDASVRIESASLGNGLGALQAQGDLAIVTGDFSSLGGRAISQAGNLDISAGNLDNRGGTLASLQGWVKVRLSGWLNNGLNADKGGVLQGQSLDLAAASVVNQSGQLSALAGDALLTTASLDNSHGALFAKQLLKVSGNSLTNAGQIAAGRVDFSLAGALNNQQGIIESDTTLALAAASLDNQGGQLRALGTGGRTQLTVNGLLDNRSGTLEIANTDFGLAAGSFQNAGGKLLHVGNGAFDISLPNVVNAGGSLVTNGGLTLNADSWTNSTTIQAGRLTVNVGQFHQTANGQLLASSTFTGSGGNWLNDGLIASDGALSLNLSGTYSGSGRVTSLGELALGAAQLALPTAGRITGGGSTTLSVGGLLSNSGVMTSASGLTINAGQLNNYGTLGSAAQLRLVTPSLLNQNGLIFSGGDMAMRVGSFTNLYADVYSLGSIDIAADDLGNQASLLSNRSGTLESIGSFGLHAALIENRRDVLTYSDGGLYTAKIEENRCVEPGVDCTGKSNTWFRITTRNKLEVTDASAAAVINAGQGLTITGGTLRNESSLISAGGNIAMNLYAFDNKGVETGETETSRVYRLTRMNRKYQLAYVRQAEDFTDKYWLESPGYQAGSAAEIAPAISAFLSGPFDGEVGYLASTTQLGAGDQRFAGIIQAGGSVSINASNHITNGVVRPYETYVSGGNKIGGTSSGGTGAITNITLNAQLPPDLAQQQINPLALPGFSIPTGSNGLFRLSNTNGSEAQADQAAQGPQNWTLGGASIGLAEREQVLTDTQARQAQINDAGQTIIGGRQLELGDRLQAEGAGIGAIQVEADDAPFGSVVPDRSGAADGSQPQEQSIARVQGLPGNQAPSKPHKYLIETNPELTHLKQFLSSDYLLGNLGYNPDQAQKRLGDGLYEQRLVREAIAARTGQRFLDGLTSDEAMFRYLMDNAIASKQQLGLSVGVSLSAAQVAALTHDIVWMEEHVVNGEKVLVPVLYLAQADGRLAPNGALIQGKDVTLISGGELTNQGTLRASDNLSATGRNLVNSGLIEAGDRISLLATDSIRNTQGGIIAGRDVSAIALTGDIVNERSVTTHQAATQSGSYGESRDFVDAAARIEAANNLSLSAGRDLANIGSVLSAGGNASLSAGRDLLIASATEVDTAEGRAKKSHWTEINITQHGSEVKVGGDLTIDAGRDLAIIASRVGAGGDIDLAAGRDLDIGSAANEHRYESHYKSGGKKLDIEQSQVRQQGSELLAGGDIRLQAGRDIGFIASSATADTGSLLLSADRDVKLASAEDRYEESYFYQKKQKGTLSSSSKTTYDANGQRFAQGSLLSADSVLVRAGNDIDVSGSSVVSTEHTSLLAGNDVRISEARESSYSEHFQERKKSGLMSSGGIGVMLGSSRQETTRQDTTDTAKNSTIGSVLGNVDIQAGKDLRIQGSDVVAGRNISLTGENVEILAADDHSRSEQIHKNRTSGLTLALSGSVGSALDATYQNARQARDEEDSRLGALQGLKAGLSGIQAGQAAQQDGGITGDNADQFFGISLSLGSQKSSSRQVQEQHATQGSSLSAGNNLHILATGKGAVGEDGDVRIQGSQLKAGQDLVVAANRDLVLEAAADTQRLEGKNSSSGGSLGVSLAGGTGGGGLSIFANANRGSGQEQGNGTSWNETSLDAGGTANLVSGRDTRLTGAQVSGEKVVANVGRDLSLQSLQDTDSYDYRQKNLSGGASVAIIGSGGSANLAASQGRIESDYRSVQEQTGLFAGAGGFQIEVGNHTQLDGAVIGSTAETERNRLSTDTLGWSEIRNEAEYKSQQLSASVSSGSDGAGSFIGNLPGGSLVAYNHGDSESGTTNSAIADGSIEIRDEANQQQNLASLSRDVENANGSIDPIFDKEREQRRLQQVQLIAEIGAQSMDVIRTEGQLRADAAAREELARQGITTPTREQLRNSDAYKRVMEDYGTGSNLQRAAQAVTAALQGLAGGDIGAALASASAPYLAEVIKRSTQGNDTAQLMAHAVLGAVVANAQGNSAAAGAVGAASGELMVKLISQALYAESDPGKLNEEQKQTISALATLAAGMAGGALGGDASSALAAAQGGRNAAENNGLGMAPGNDLGFWFLKSDDCNTDCKSQIAQQTAEGGLLASGALAAAVGGGALTAAAIAAARSAAVACSTNPALCVSEAGLFVNDLVLSEALPAGLGIAAGTKLTVEQASEIRILMELEKQTGTKVSVDAVRVALGAGGAKGVVGFADDAARAALSNIGRVDHSARHLIDAGIIIANSGSKAARQAFQEIGRAILTNPTKTFDHVMTQGGQAVKGFYGKIDGNDVVIFVAKEARGKIAVGDIVTAIKPSAQQMKNFGL